MVIDEILRFGSILCESAGVTHYVFATKFPPSVLDTSHNLSPSGVSEWMYDTPAPISLWRSDLRYTFRTALRVWCGHRLWHFAGGRISELINGMHL